MSSSTRWPRWRRMRAAQADAPAFAGASATRAHRLSVTVGLRAQSDDCPCCGGVPRQLGEDFTETLEVIPRQWEGNPAHEREVVVSILRRNQPTASAARRARPARTHYLLQIWSSTAAHTARAQPSSRGIDLDVSTLADWVNAAAATLMPLVVLIRKHVFTAERNHADDITIPVLA